MSDGTPILQSDADFREDIAPMLVKNWKSAEHLKGSMEQQQRDDAKLRKAAANRRK